MRVGIPMNVMEAGESMAWCEGRGRRERLNMLLVGPQEAGTGVLAFEGSVREVLTGEQAAQFNDAPDTVEAVMNGSPDISAHFTDLRDTPPDG